MKQDNDFKDNFREAQDFLDELSIRQIHDEAELHGKELHQHRLME
jgi:hypothetical protein